MRLRTSSPSVFLVGVALALALSVAVGSAGAAGPDPSEVYVESLRYGGSGCPQGSVGQSLSDDRTTFTLIFDAYAASLGPGVPITENRKNCQLNVRLHVPQGWTYTVFAADYRGFVQIDNGVSAVQKSTYYFAGQTQQVSVQSTLVGPVSRDFLRRDQVGVISWVPACNASANLNVNSQVRLFSPSSAQGQITNDSTDGKFKFLLGFRWRPC